MRQTETGVLINVLTSHVLKASLTLFALALGLACAACGGEQSSFANPGPGPSPDTGLNDDTNNPECTSDSDCALAGECCRGQCVTAGFCNTDLCEAQGQVCQLSGNSGIEEQGDFYCALFNQNPDPLCLGRCDKPFTADTCETGSFCLNVNAANETLSVCLPSECTESRTCRSFGPEGGTCVDFGNRAGFCFNAGTAPQGAPCVNGGGVPEQTCGPDLFCVAEAGSATCQPLCDMWQGEDVCPSGRACGYLTVGTGVCRGQTDTGRELAEPCDPIGAWCTSGAQCLDFRTGGETLPVCTGYCRPGLEDCRGRFQDRNGFCRTVFSDANGDPVEDIGLCL